MWFYDNLELIVGGVFVSGVAMHFAGRWRDRRRYLRLRRACVDSVYRARKADHAPDAVVREAELYRAFKNSWMPGWFEGFGRSVRTWLKVCAAFTLLAFFLKGPIERGEAEYARGRDHFARTTGHCHSVGEVYPVPAPPVALREFIHGQLCLVADKERRGH